MYKLFIQHDQLPSALNKKLNAHFHQRHRENKNWDDLMVILCNGKKPPLPLHRAKITLVRHSYRFLDYDGLVGSMKPVVDALVSAGVLFDDSWGVLGAWDVHQRFRPKAQGPLLEIMVQGMPDKLS